MHNSIAVPPEQGSPADKSLTVRRARDRWAGRFLTILAIFPVILILFIIIVLVVRSWPILKSQPLWNLLTGLDWHPARGNFGFYPFIIGTFWVTVLAMLLAVPPCLLTAIYLAEYARASTRALMKPLIDLLAAIPSVVYGVWGMVAIVPWVEKSLAPFMGKWFGAIPLFKGTNPTGFSVMSGGIVLAVMVAPFIIAVTYEVLRAVPDGLREASLAVGATRWETIKSAVIPSSIAGVIAGVVLGSSRALGETMAVMMVVGNVPIVPKSIFDPAYPLPALIANNYGDMMSIPLYDAALLSAALILLVIVLIFNIISTLVLRQIIRRSKA